MKLRLKHVLALLLIATVAVGSGLFSGMVTVRADGVTVLARTRTNVRSGPATTYAIIGHLSQGDVMTVTGRSSISNDWLRIDFNGSEGWVAASVVTVSGDPTTIPIVEPSAAVATSGNTGVTATIYGENSIRSGPATGYSIIATIPEDTSATYDITGILEFAPPLECTNNRIVDVTNSGYQSSVWLRLNAGGQDGWIPYTSVTVSGALCSISEVSFTAAEATTTLGDGTYVKITRSVNLRATSWAQSEVLAVIPSGTIIQAEAKNSAGNRIRVTYQGQIGWLSLNYVSVVQGRIGNLDVAE
ncbi:MAG: SH3 domain-containing protein [Anaerolineae bacterium]